MWATEYGNNLIARITTSGTVNEFPVPTPNAGVYGITSGTSDGDVYFTERLANQVGKIRFPTACTATLQVPPGTATATIVAYDATGGAGGSGHPLSTQTVSVTVRAGRTNTLNFVLNGIVNAAQIYPGNVDPGCSTSGAYPLSFQATDASGNVIVGPGGYVDAKGNPLTFTCSRPATSQAAARS